jgi:hypothetical protein
LTFIVFNSKIRHVSNAHNNKIARLLTSLCIVTIALLLLLIVVPLKSTQAATPEVLKWSRVNIPTEGTAGGWVLASGSDIQYLTTASDGTLYAYVKGLTCTLYKSTDGGLRWFYIGNVQDAITGIAVSPNNPKTIYYATASLVYRSDDGGKNFTSLPDLPGSSGANITSIAVTWLNNNIIAVGTADVDNAEFGGVYLFDEGELFSGWVNTDVGDYDIYAVDFPANYAVTRQIVAVANNEIDTFIINKIGDTAWNTIIGSAKFNKDNSIIPVNIASVKGATITLPENYDTDTSSGNSFFFVGIDTGTNGGDVYKIVNVDVPEYSVVTDLNCGGAYSVTGTDISGLTVYSDAHNVLLLAGAAVNSRTYISKDGGISWTKSKKNPSGATDTKVLIAPDFASTGMIYAATSGNNSALSVSRDLGTSWNQISLIDTNVTNIVDFTPSPETSPVNTMYIITSGMGHSLWRSMNDGFSWERILYTNTTMDGLKLIGLPPQYGIDCLTLFVAGQSNGTPAIWESKDNGQNFQYFFTHDTTTGAAFDIDVWAISNKNTIYVGSFNGSRALFYRSTNSGNSYSQGTSVGVHPFHSLALSPNFENDGIILAGDENGWIYCSNDNGSSFQTLPADTATAPLDGEISVAFDPEFKTNHTIYAASNIADSGIYRFIIGSSDSWEQIDDTLPAGAITNRLAFSVNGVLYAVNEHANGGMERCLNPRFSLGPVFETITRGLSDGSMLMGLWQHNQQLWSLDNHNANDVKLLTYHDTLALPPVQISPEDGISGIGSLVDHSVRNIIIDWETLDGATSYEWQCNYITDFSTVPDDLNGTTSASSVRLPALEPATTYYWRVRACAPVLSPWSEKRSFTTSMDTENVNLKPETPSPGASEVAIKPVFQWTAVIGAEAYELLVATDGDFNHPVIVKMNEYPLKNNAWECDVSLDYDTVYYWKIRAITASTYSAWSSIGIFTTESVPSEENMPLTPTPPISITPELLATFSSPTILPSTSPPSAPKSSSAATILDMPAWMIYLVGGLFGIVFLALLIVLVVVIKIRRI